MQMLSGCRIVMSVGERKYIAIDLKSFYASVECVERGLDPLDACLVVADITRTEKTICLAVSPSLKSYGIGGRPRLFEVVQKVRELNRGRGRSGCSTSGAALSANSGLAVDYIVAKPRMALYIEYSRRIYDVYLRFVAPEDMHIYSVDEVFIDATDYMRIYHCTAYELAMRMIRAVLAETGITATAGIGTNLYLCKVAMDIEAKKKAPDAAGVRIAELDEMSYRRLLWDHEPLTDFWRVGRGTVNKLAPYGIRTMGDIARCSLTGEALLYRLFGVNAELLIDHAWGWEPVTIAQIKGYRPESHSHGMGQVLHCPYTFDNALVVAMEMADALSLELLDKHLLARQVVLEVGYDTESLSRPGVDYGGCTTVDRYGRRVPKHAHASANFEAPTCSSAQLMSAIEHLFKSVVDAELLVRRITITAANVVYDIVSMHSGAPCGCEPGFDVVGSDRPRQLTLFGDYDVPIEQLKRDVQECARERRRQQAILNIKKMFGKNAILRGLNFAEGATQRMRNAQIGGHHE